MSKYTHTSIPVPSDGGHYAELAAWLDVLDVTEVLDRLSNLRRKGDSYVGRRGYDHEPLLRAYLLSYCLGNIGSTNDLINRLREQPQLRAICGFSGELPHRTTFNRFYSKVANFCPDPVDGLLAQMNGKLSKELPGYGKAIAIDGTNVYTHARQPAKGEPPSTTSDPEAGWSVKGGSKASPKKE